MAKVKSRYLAGAAGCGASRLCYLLYAILGGAPLVAYQDSGKVWTICDGKTKRYLGVHETGSRSVRSSHRSPTDAR